MLKEINWSEDRSYRTGSENEPLDFYLNGLNNSTSVDLLLGYFSSAAINVLSLGFAKFIHKGGVLRLVVNNILSEQDKEAIKLGQDSEIEKRSGGNLQHSQLKRRRYVYRQWICHKDLLRNSSLY